jgi:hypothetical protein
VSVALYMDHHVPSGVTRGLRQRGVDVLTAGEDGRARLDDEELFARSTGLDRVIYSQDEDFLEIAARWQKMGRRFAGLVYARQGRIAIGKAIEDLEFIAKTAEPSDMENRVYWLPL